MSLMIAEIERRVRIQRLNAFVVLNSRPSFKSNALRHVRKEPDFGVAHHEQACKYGDAD